MNTTALKSRLDGKLQARQSEPAERTNTMQSTSLTPIASEYMALTNNALDIISENLKNQPLSPQLFDVIKSPSGGATVFTVPGIGGDEFPTELSGIILDYTTPRAYWDTPEPVEGTPPVCFSRDSLVSHDGKRCGHCVYNDFGSKDGDSDANRGPRASVVAWGGKACKEFVELCFLRPDKILPVIVRIPVSSKMIFLRYVTRLVGGLVPISGVVTKITLTKATSKTGKPYALYNFEAVNTLAPEEAAGAKTFGAKFMEIVNAAFEVEGIDVVMEESA